jgi:carbamoyltransferase
MSRLGGSTVSGVGVVRVLGVVANTHDSGVALLNNGVPEFVFEEERFNRVKRTMRFPDESLRALVRETGLGLGDIAAVTTPWHMGRLRRSFAGIIAANFPHSLNLLHSRAHSAQRNQIVILNHYIRRHLKQQFGDARRLPPLINVGHHDAHAAVFFVSPFEEAHVLVMDGYGDDASSSAYFGRGNHLDRQWSAPIMNSLGLVYTFVSEYLGFNGFGDEGKVMALAAFGGPAYVERFRDVVRPTADGGYAVDMDYFAFDTYGQLRPFKQKFFDVFGLPRAPGEPMTDRHRDVAHALQAVTEEIILHIVRARLKTHPSRDLVMTGGVALNCVANGKILSETGVRRLWVPPCASDTGAPLGSALWYHHQTLGVPRTFELTSPYLGQSFGDGTITAALRRAGLGGRRLGERELLRRTARDLAAGKIVGWYQGRFEMGPRALGNRSILADPRRAEMRDVINARIKKRESFRPFAPVVLADRAADYFEVTQPDPFMTLAPRVRPDKRDKIAAAVHVDGTGRIQTVTREANPRYYGVIEEFGRLTGVPVLINTSFNEQEPIVARPEEAIACFLRTDIDVLVLGNYYIAGRGMAFEHDADAGLDRAPANGPIQPTPMWADGVPAPTFRPEER